MNAAVTEAKQWTLVEAALSLSRPLGTTCFLFALLALAGYFGNVEALYRPLQGGPATHPLTALCVLLLALGVRVPHNGRNSSRFSLGCSLLVAAIAALRLTEISLGNDLTYWLTPFHAALQADLQSGGQNSMGTNSALMMLTCSVALAFFRAGLANLSQITASVAAAIPITSFTGYSYGLEGFYGQMSLLTATVGLGLAIATLSLTADHGGLRALLSPHIGGRVARAQVIFGYLIPTGMGFLLVKSFTSGTGQPQSLFGMFVVAVCWFIILMVSVSSIYIEKADFARRRSEAKLAAAALTDELTGLPNRRKFFDAGRHELERIKRTRGELWVLMIDLDHFKKINDTAGHAVGDQVLVATATVLKQSVRKVDIASRLGGEEFAVLLTETGRAGCDRVAESIRNNIESLPIPGWTDIHGPVTTSIGCARLLPTGSLDETLHAADEALYRAKHCGRNQVAVNDGDAIINLQKDAY
ncbi:GGDEF domain-containing protein [Marinobacterium lutimaris]|uniref:diguanylate cyclase n=1 Tax=Marinobacterium lutimaris TaxID=568106 RepID=A0A1H6AY88_9GAMM|nr:GGDEF domain-containing protein [Marinobacterium lutimaris]SEG53027.1 diguanylate cyclase (GGDEF) domain-containing protein [Marinobacterium lutimaris]